MITGTVKRHQRTVIAYNFELPLNAREIADAILQVNRAFGERQWDDDYMVKSDGETLTFYWVEKESNDKV